MRIVQPPSFNRTIKRFTNRQKKSLDKAVRTISEVPTIGIAKIGDLAGIHVFKFRSDGVEWLLAYRVISEAEIKLLVVGPHENFYRDLKRSL